MTASNQKWREELRRIMATVAYEYHRSYSDEKGEYVMDLGFVFDFIQKVRDDTVEECAEIAESYRIEMDSPNEPILIYNKSLDSMKTEMSKLKGISNNNQQ